ncbi:TetR/AcrR family transcriptional regulator [Streptomonospora nanhaiensis]|uniref:TetR/AcrR family transcriptional regulator n=1 Tax=Streptomonospora nanhaiensis TaxID=1323731 RepID=UPI001C996DEC|nr:TetR/AcrR family transcriptional regulator C-terminal domain-containing protein [Streptomonospora nanhaiensis]MBX9386802.1 TetR/AcrR family transcriptional regulator C-terminal domain-containing protein [Streptomonospora nanhaiensis]
MAPDHGGPRKPPAPGDSLPAAERTAGVLWDDPAQPRRGPKPSLSRAAVVAAGISLADAEGLAALSMQRVADALGYTKMSLYRYAPGRAELIALMVEEAVGPPPDLAAEPPGWRPRLRAWASALLPRLSAHPWAVEASTGPRVMGPNELAWLEAGLAAMRGTGLTGAERLDAAVLLLGHVRGIAQQGAAAPGGDGGAGAVEGELGRVMAGVLRRRGGDFPEAGGAGAAAAAGTGQDRALEFGLERILDGLAVLVRERTGEG